ncbi:LRP5_6 [Mytilus coruscus]|uniref:LRP5_6 n=1 Tax=Mytilus coruscus TaxID=42192 RepID=A0A6J8BGI9_MYTCO|nr:LRP5_6 [Mytilus coruscus]
MEVDVDTQMVTVLVNHGDSYAYSFDYDYQNRYVYFPRYNLRDIVRFQYPSQIILLQHVVTTSPFPSGIAVDYANDHVYWVYTNGFTLSRCKLDGTNVLVISNSLSDTFMIRLDVINRRKYAVIKQTSPIVRTTMKTEIQVCVCVALAAVCIAGVRSAGSYGGESYGRGVYGRTASHGGGYRRGYSQGYGGGGYSGYGKGGSYRPTSRGGGSLYYPYYYPVPYFVGGRRRGGGNVRVTPAIIARTGGRRRGGGGGGGGLFGGGGGGGFGGIFNLITGNKSEGSNHGNDILGAHKAQPLGVHRKVLFASSDSIFEVDVDTRRVTVLVQYGQDIVYSLDYDYENNYMYVPRYNAGDILRFKYPSQSITLQHVVNTSNIPVGVAVDSANDHVYWVSNGLTILSRCNLDGTNVVVVFTGSSSTHMVRLDLTNRWMYIGYPYAGISKSRFDLTDIRMIANFTVWAGCMDIDLTEQRLYWMNADGDIKAVNVDGSNVKTIISTHSSIYNYFAIGVSGSYIYYANSNHQLVMRKTSHGSPQTVLYTDTSLITSIYVFNSTGL